MYFLILFILFSLIQVFPMRGIGSLSFSASGSFQRTAMRRTSWHLNRTLVTPRNMGHTRRTVSVQFPLVIDSLPAVLVSIRGWGARELGDLPPAQSPQYGGNTLLELSLEDRFQIIGDFGGVVFIDAGDLWNSYRDVTLKSIAVAIGFGLRYNTFFGPLRIDLGNRLYDPSAPGGLQFPFQRLTFREWGSRVFVPQFNIQQAF